MRKPILAIIGQPNVGKSTLFNRIIRRREAIVDDQPGVTRDRNYAEAEWSGIAFTLMDTGGYLPDKQDMIHKAVLNQVMEAIRECDVIIYLVDAKSGLTNMDHEISGILRKSLRKVILVVNKVDNENREMDVHEFHKLGLGDPVPISAISGRSIGDLLDIVIAAFPAPTSDEDEVSENVIKLAVVGKPNVGKSSFVNALLGREKHIVTDIPGTTRDAIDTRYSYNDQDYLLIDTAGLRKRSKVTDEVEYYSTVRTMKSIRECDIAIILIDARDGIQDQDKSIIEQALKFNKGVLLAVNKWDLIDKDMHTSRQFELDIQDNIPYLSFLPIIFMSAVTKQRIFKALDIVKSIFDERRKKLKTSELNNFLEEALTTNPPPAPGGKHIKINYCTQIKSPPPVFAFFCNYPDLIKSNYRQYLEHKIRERFGFFGVPITLKFRRK